VLALVRHALGLTPLRRLRIKAACRGLTLIESARLVGHDPDYYLKAAVGAALDKTTIPLPHELPLRS